MRYLFFGIFIFVLGCNQNEIEIVPDYDSEYTEYKYTDSKPEIISKTIAPLLNEETLNKLNKKLPKLDKDYFIDLRTVLYIDENGNIDAVKFEENVDVKNGKSEITKPSIELIKKAITVNLNELEIRPAIKDGKRVKVSWTSIFPLKLSKDGNVSFWNKPVGFDELKPPEDFKGDNYFTKVDLMPSPLGGIQAIAEKVKYPIEAKNSGVQGRVFLRAFIDENGNVVNVELIKGIGYGCDEAALEAVIKTKFNPGFLNGKAVETQVTIPIMFSLK